ncbi:transaldolase [Actinomadura macra]|uniref:transaldolase n=1 Tax=Actinomadura macra TaxID=46164 RepID=UPI0008310CC7|nr:transaldolase [Actinomadura macra]
MSDVLKRLAAEGVSIWLDDLSRERLTGGGLSRLVASERVVGVTTNPTIFRNAIAGAAGAYDEQLRELADRGVDPDEAVRMLTTADVREAADVLRPVHENTGGRDGRISIEVDPRLAHHTAATIAEARHLWWLVDRPNLMVKIPATIAGLPAISAVIGGGVSVNVTLIFSLDRYRAVLDAYLSGLESARRSGADLSAIESVGSFFVSRVDTEVDRRLRARGPAAAALAGRAGMANARLAYQIYEEFFTGPRWDSLAADGARPQRPLWTSTSTKDPAYPDTCYVDGLVAPGTVNTIPEATLEAVAHHGAVGGDQVRGRYAEARADLDALTTHGIDYDEVVQLLEEQGVAKFEESWADLLDVVAKRLADLRAPVAS